MALAMVFSVQQGEHGPLVVYKLKVRGGAVPAAQAVPPAQAVPGPAVQSGAAAGEPVYVVPSRAPQVLATVTLPAAASGVTASDLVEQMAPAAVPREALLDWHGDGAMTLEQVNQDITWRRETAEKLRDLPFSPRF